jgi:hypothetical protein
MDKILKKALDIRNKEKEYIYLYEPKMKNTTLHVIHKGYAYSIFTKHKVKFGAARLAKYHKARETQRKKEALFEKINKLESLIYFLQFELKEAQDEYKKIS